MNNFFLWYDSQNCPFFVWFSELNFFTYDSGKWTFFFFQIRLTELIFLQEWRKELNLLLMRRKELNFFLICLKELRLFSKYDSKNWTFFPSIWLKELNLFFELDSKGWTFLLSMTQRIELFSIWLKELNVFFEYDTKNWTSFWVWYKESNSFLNTTRRIEPSLTWLEELIFFFFEKKKNKNDSKNWNFLSMSQRIEFLSFFGRKKTTQRIELFSKIRYKELNSFSIWLNFFFFQNMTRRI